MQSYFLPLLDYISCCFETIVHLFLFRYFQIDQHTQVPQMLLDHRRDSYSEGRTRILAGLEYCGLFAAPLPNVFGLPPLSRIITNFQYLSSSSSCSSPLSIETMFPYVNGSHGLPPTHPQERPVANPPYVDQGIPIEPAQLSIPHAASNSYRNHHYPPSETHKFMLVTTHYRDNVPVREWVSWPATDSPTRATGSESTICRPRYPNRACAAVDSSRRFASNSYWNHHYPPSETHKFMLVTTHYRDNVPVRKRVSWPATDSPTRATGSESTICRPRYPNRACAAVDSSRRFASNSYWNHHYPPSETHKFMLVTTLYRDNVSVRKWVSWPATDSPTRATGSESTICRPRYPNRACAAVDSSCRFASNSYWNHHYPPSETHKFMLVTTHYRDNVPVRKWVSWPATDSPTRATGSKSTICRPRYPNRACAAVDSSRRFQFLPEPSLSSK